MKKTRLVLILLLMTIQIGFAQKSMTKLKIKTSDTLRLTFYTHPFVRIFFNEPKALRSFDYNATQTASTIISNLIIQNNFKLTESIYSNIDSSGLINRSKIAEEMLTQNEEYSTFHDNLSALADGYTDRYICFVFQNGFYSSAELEREIIKNNNKGEFKALMFNGINPYEVFFVSASQINLIVWDNLKDEEFLNAKDLRIYRINVDIFQKQSIEWQMKKVIRRLNRSIRKL